MQYPASISQQYKITVRVLVVGSLLSVHATFTYLPVASQLGNYCSESQTELIITENLLSLWHLAQNFLSFPLLQIFLKFSDSKQFFSIFFKVLFGLFCHVQCFMCAGSRNELAVSNISLQKNKVTRQFPNHGFL